jgi:hypothetical protein
VDVPVLQRPVQLLEPPRARRLGAHWLHVQVPTASLLLP